MKTTLAVLVFLLAATALSVASTVVIMRGTGGAGSGCTSAGSSSFSADPQSDGSWNTDVEEDATGFVWDGTNNNEIVTSQESGVMNALTYTAAEASSVNMWVKIKYTTVTVGNPGITLRRSTSNGARYIVVSTASATYWKYWSGSPSSAPATIATLTGCNPANGDVIAAYITGTGTDTVLKVWKNPSGATPTDWGDANVCDSDTTDPSTAVDSGTYGGIYHGTSNATARTMVVDDFSVGGCT